MNVPSLHLVCAAAATAAFVPQIQAQALSNGTGGGDFNTNGTWALNAVPTGGFRVLAGDTVTASAGVSLTTNSNSDVLGTLTLASGASITMGRLNNNLAVADSTINITGGTLSVTRLSGSGSNNTINLSAGSLIVREPISIPSHYIFNVSGGVFRTIGGVANNLTLTGGTIIFEGSAQKTAGTFSWSGGTVILSSGAAYSANSVNQIFNAWKTNAANVLALSSQTTRQTITIGSNNFPTITSETGVMSFNVYSATDNDNDLLELVGTSALTLTSGVEIQIENVSLHGGESIADYLGKSFQLFSIESGNYANINATVTSTYWTIGGEEYLIGWINNLSEDGTLTIGSLTSTAIPEPASAVAFGGLAALAFASMRRRNRR